MRVAMRLQITLGDILHLGFQHDRGSTAGRVAESPPKLILVMDPDRDAREICRLALESEGYRVATAENSADCLRLARSQAPDLIVTELFSPGMDGYGMMRALGRGPGTSGIPVVALTTCSLPSYRLRALREGFSGYLGKPVEPRRLIRAIAPLLKSADPGQPEPGRPLARTGS